MNRPFWSRRTETNPCESIEPLLSLYADRMASPEEMRRVDAHLPGCERCREALAWMQATRRALAARPIALPPADLHSRIAQAIAAAPPLTPGVLRPVRSFTLRPAYAAAASLTVLGAALSYPLWHAQNVAVKPAPPYLASTLPSAKPHSSALPHAAPTRPRVASVTPEAEPAARPLPAPRKPARLSATPPKEQVANAVPVPALPPAPVRNKTVRPSVSLPHDKIASVKVVPLEDQQPADVKVLPAPKPMAAPKIPDAPLVAAHEKELPPSPVKIQPFIVVPEAPPVQTASAASRPKPDDSMGKLAEFAQKLRNAPYAPSRFRVRQASTGAANALQPLESESLAYYGAIHSDTAIK